MGRKYFKDLRKTSFLRENSGMTLSEIIVVVAILGLLIVLAAMSLNPKLQMAKARDSRREADLKRISTALEDYAGDHPCYPTAIYQGSGCTASAEINPYLRNIPCDPLTKAHYYYDNLDDPCKKYAIYASLETVKNITYRDNYNYAVTSPNVKITPMPTGTSALTSIPEPINTPVPTAAPSETPYSLFGCFNGVCKLLTGPSPYCLPNYSNLSDCVDDCCRGHCIDSITGDPINDYGSESCPQ